MTPPALDPDAKQRLLRQLPKVDAVLAEPALMQALRRLGRTALTAMVREAVGEERRIALRDGVAPSAAQVLARVEQAVEALLGRRSCRVINATGVVLHTNLGRAPLSEAAAAALAEGAAGYTALEIDLATGQRGARAAFAEQALARLTGAEDALVVNNNAAAVLLALTALARGRSVVVSRGEQVEIGGGFRVPDVLARSGARMIEVGTTNRTRVADYRRAIADGEDVAVLLRVHQGNFQQTGFVERPALGALARLADEHGILLVKDLGGGALIDLEACGLAGEPQVQACLGAGAHLVCFSADKVLGGPQAGVMVGRAELVDSLRRDPLARALRLGRLPLVALEATVQSYLEGRAAELPALAALLRPLAQVRERVVRWCEALAQRGVVASPVEVAGAVGGGALAGAELRSVAAVVKGDAEALATRLRRADPPVVGRVQGGQLHLDGRTVLASEDELLLDAVVAAEGAAAAPTAD